LLINLKVSIQLFFKIFAVQLDFVKHLRQFIFVDFVHHLLKFFHGLFHLIRHHLLEEFFQLLLFIEDTLFLGFVLLIFQAVILILLFQFLDFLLQILLKF